MSRYWSDDTMVRRHISAANAEYEEESEIQRERTYLKLIIFAFFET